jgi:hypothetical protein
LRNIPKKRPKYIKKAGLNFMYIQATNVVSVAAQIAQLTSNRNDVAVIFIGEKTDINVPALLVALNQQNVSFLGGIFPGVVVGRKNYESGIAVDVIPALAKPVLIKNIQETSFSVEMLNPLVRLQNEAKAKSTLLVLVDGLTTNIGLMLSRIFGKFKKTVSYIGGGAGSLTLKQTPCVFDNSGIYQDAAVVALLKVQSQIGVRHGWHDMRGPFIANRTNRNVVLQLNHEPAIKKYREIMQLVTRQILTKENFFEIAKGYPLGLNYQGFDRIVRDPIAFTDEGGLVCVGEVPENSQVYILKGNNRSLILDANRATREALVNRKALDHFLIVDCISRVLFLQDHFSEELDTVQTALPGGFGDPVGILSLGEIASYGNGSVEFFNKTFVACAMQNQPEPASV